MILTPRLKAIADRVPQGSRLGDVGSDHGYLPVYLVENGIVSLAIASDINQGPVDNALEAVHDAGLENQIEVRLGGGLEPYVLGEINVATIAGMGGLLIRDILNQSDALAKTLDKIIVQPMVSQSDLREWLSQNGYTIFEETIVREGSKFYEIFSIRKGISQPLDELTLEMGIDMIHLDNPDSLAWLDYKINKYQLIKKKILKHGSPNADQVLQKSLRMIDKLEAMKAHVCKL